MPLWEFVRARGGGVCFRAGGGAVGGEAVGGQFTPFDLIGVLLGNAVQNSLIGQDTSLLGGLLLLGTLSG